MGNRHQAVTSTAALLALAGACATQTSALSSFALPSTSPRSDGDEGAAYWSISATDVGSAVERIVATSNEHVQVTIERSGEETSLAAPGCRFVARADSVHVSEVSSARLCEDTLRELTEDAAHASRSDGRARDDRGGAEEIDHDYCGVVERANISQQGTLGVLLKCAALARYTGSHDAARVRVRGTLGRAFDASAWAFHCLLAFDARAEAGAYCDDPARLVVPRSLEVGTAPAEVRLPIRIDRRVPSFSRLFDQEEPMLDIVVARRTTPRTATPATPRRSRHVAPGVEQSVVVPVVIAEPGVYDVTIRYPWTEPVTVEVIAGFTTDTRR